MKEDKSGEGASCQRPPVALAGAEAKDVGNNDISTGAFDNISCLLKRAHRTFAAALVLVFLLCNSDYAQQTTGSLQGIVVDTLGQPLRGVNISVHGSHVQGVRGCVSDNMGSFDILVLPPGKVSIKVSHAAYQEAVFEDVLIELGKSTNLGEIRLHPRSHDVPGVIVTAKHAGIEEGTTYGSNLRSSDFEQLPVQRNYGNMVSLLPQVNTSYYGDGVNIGGATGFENKYFVDGAEVTDPLIGASGTNLPYNFIQEVEVKAGGYEAEFRSSLGGLINAVTYSGTNEIHGSVFGFYNSNRLTGSQNLGLLDPTQGDFSNYDIGFSLGGPIVRDKLWMFVAYNPTINLRDVAVPGFGTSVDRTLIHSFAGKLTWTVSQQARVLITATGDPTTRRAVGRNILVPPSALLNSDPYFYDIVDGGINLAINGAYMPIENLLFEVSGSRVNRHDTGEPATAKGKDEPLFRDQVTGIWSGGVGSSWDSFRFSTEAGLNGTLLIGAHVFKAGFKYKSDGVDNYYDNHTIDEYDDTTYYEYVGKGFGEVHNQTTSVFLQDTWQILRSLTIYAGIRWDGQSIIGSRGAVVQKITVPLQPRIGFTFLPTGDGSQKIFGSLGRFSQEFALFQSVNYHSGNGFDVVTVFSHDPRVSDTGGTVIYDAPHTIKPEVPGLRGQFYDEASLGYERSLGAGIRVTIQGVYRTLREAIDDVYLSAEGRYQLGNPGSGPLAEWPKPQRDYTALIVTIERHDDEHFNFLISYVLSRDYGNYEGLFDALNHSSFPNANSTFNDLSTARENTMGLLPNDKTHVLKLSSSYRFNGGLSAGLTFVAQSGTPLSEYAYTDVGVKLLTPRGTMGRTPALWDLSARLAYELPLPLLPHARLIADVFHIASQRKPVDIDQVRYWYVDPNGNLLYPNSTYGQAFRYQPPMSVRVGVEVSY